MPLIPELLHYLVGNPQDSWPSTFEPTRLLFQCTLYRLVDRVPIFDGALSSSLFSMYVLIYLAHLLIASLIFKAANLSIFFFPCQKHEVHRLRFLFGNLLDNWGTCALPASRGSFSCYHKSAFKKTLPSCYGRRIVAKAGEKETRPVLRGP